MGGVTAWRKASSRPRTAFSNLARCSLGGAEVNHGDRGWGRGGKDTTRRGSSSSSSSDRSRSAAPYLETTSCLRLLLRASVVAYDCPCHFDHFLIVLILNLTVWSKGLVETTCPNFSDQRMRGQNDAVDPLFRLRRNKA